ncbi:hypothetical protein [Actinoplanes sp. NPDC048796]
MADLPLLAATAAAGLVAVAAVTVLRRRPAGTSVRCPPGRA